MKTQFLSAVLMLFCACAQAAGQPGGSHTAAALDAAVDTSVDTAADNGAAATPASEPALTFPSTGTLYQRLGGKDGLTAIVREATRNHLKNPVHKTRFEVMSDPAKVERMLIEYFSQAAGGPVVYSGKNMVAAHRGMNLNGQEYLAFMDDIVGAMDKLGVSGGTKFELIGMMYRIKDHIMHK
jgi:hemoglobin